MSTTTQHPAPEIPDLVTHLDPRNCVLTVQLSEQAAAEINARHRERVQDIQGELDDLRFVMKRQEPWNAKAQAMLDAGRWAGRTYIEGTVTELEDARAQLAELTAERDLLEKRCAAHAQKVKELEQICDGWKAEDQKMRGRLAERDAELATWKQDYSAAIAATKDLAGKLTERERQLAQTTAELDKLRLDVAELTGRLKERQMATHEQEKGLLEQVRGMRTVAEEALVVIENLSDYFESTAERKGGKWWEWKECARRLRDQIASWRMRLNAGPTPTGDREGGAA